MVGALYSFFVFESSLQQ